MSAIVWPDCGFETTVGERRMFGLRAELDIVEFAARHLKLPDSPLSERAPIAWSPDLFPPQTAVIEAMGDPRWSRVILVTGPQMFGKTVCIAAGLLYAADYRHQSAFYVSSARDLADTQWRTKFRPAIEADPGLRQTLLPETRDEIGRTFRRDLRNGTSIHFAGAESVGALSGFTSPIVIVDDAHAAPAGVPQIGNPIEYAFSRSKAFPREMRLHVVAGTATTPEAYLWRLLLRSTQYMPFIRCLDCGTYQLLEWERLSSAEGDPLDTWMRCANPACDHELRFEELPEMLAEQMWVSAPPDDKCWTEPPEGGTRIELGEAAVYPETDRPTTACGFVANGLLWPYGESWGEHVAAGIEARGDPDKQRELQINVQVRPWADPEVEDGGMDAALIEARADGEYSHGTLPGEVDLLTVTVDVQGGYVYYIVRGWTKSNGSSWLIDVASTKERHATSGLPGGLEHVVQIEAAGWPFAPETSRAGEVLHATLGLIDSKYMPDLVWRHCVRYGLRKWRPIQGTWQAREIWPRQPRTVAGRRYWPIAVNEAKSALSKLLAIPPGQSGYWHMPADLSPRTLKTYARHMTSEVWDKIKRRWVRRKEVGEKGAGRNDWWDCEVYQVAAARACGVPLPAFDKPVEAAPVRRRTRPAGPRRAPIGPRAKVRRRY